MLEGKAEVHGAPGLVLQQQVDDDFVYLAPEGYTGDICTICHMPPNPECRPNQGGVVGINHDTQKPQMDPTGPVSHWKACPQKVTWRNEHEPRSVVSKGGTELPPPGKPVSTLSDLENIEEKGTE